MRDIPIRSTRATDSNKAFVLKAVRKGDFMTWIEAVDAEGKLRAFRPEEVRRLCARCTTRVDRGGRPKRGCMTCDGLIVEVWT